MRAALEELTRALEREHERAAYRESVIDRLHEENQQLRRGEREALLDPIRAALYRVHDMAYREAGRWAEPKRPAASRAAPLFAAIADEIADALARTGVERYDVEPGELYDPAWHRAVGSTPVSDQLLDGTVVEGRTKGFARDDHAVRRADVIIRRFVEGER